MINCRYRFLTHQEGTFKVWVFGTWGWQSRFSYYLGGESFERIGIAAHLKQWRLNCIAKLQGAT
jgi:hypothetical protein